MQLSVVAAVDEIVQTAEDPTPPTVPVTAQDMLVSKVVGVIAVS